MDQGQLEYFDKINADYGVSKEKSGNIWLQRKVRLAGVAILKKIMPTSVLEIGCGNGLFLILAAQALPGSLFTGIDFSKDMLDICVGRLSRLGIGNVTLKQTDASSLPFAEGSFEAVVLINTMQNIPDQEVRGVLRESNRVLKPGGHIFFDFRNRSNPLVVYGIRHKKVPLLVLSYTYNEIELLLGKHDFRIIRSFGIGRLLSFGIGKLAPAIGVLAVKTCQKQLEELFPGGISTPSVGGSPVSKQIQKVNSELAKMDTV